MLSLLISTLLVRLLPVPDSFILFLLIQIVGLLFQVVLFIAIALSYQWLRQQEEQYYNSTDNSS